MLRTFLVRLAGVLSTLMIAHFSISQVTTPRVPSPGATVTQTIGISTVNVNYSRPSVKGREIWGKLVPYGWNVQAFGLGNSAPWRAGANEATEIEFFRDVKIDNKKLPKGRYTLYAIPSATKWILVFNKETDTWGAFGYDAKKDVLRAEVKVVDRPDIIEVFTICFEGTDKTKTSLMIAWDNKEVHLPIKW